MRVPRSVEEITAEWIGEMLGAGGAADLPAVTGVRTRVIGVERGFLSLTVQVEIDYAAERLYASAIELEAGALLP